MLIQLPVETWIEILDWLRRRDLIKKLNKLWDRQFTPIVQDWLHKYTRNVKIGKLSINSDGLSVLSCGEWKKVPFAGVELPENVTSFERISISYMDFTVLAFLRQMSPLFHNNNINLILIVYYHANELPTQTALHALMPMISSIESIDLNYELLQFFSTNYSSALLNVKLLQVFGFFNSDMISVELTSWLFTSREDGQPRTLVLYNSPAGFWEKIRERFLDPVRQLASPFFLRMRNNLSNASAENVRTGEQLIVKRVFSSVLITNCALNVDPEWLAKKTEEVCKWNFHDQPQTIWLNSSKIGPLDPIGDDNDPQQQPLSDTTEENAQEKPGTSNAQNLEEEEEPGKKRARLI